ncbi:MAG: hypothetical protein NTW86_27345 [Candidatus Sumerlaeota bacterium]|nr:hypothetical protein [Candidatus Sumerlaeota bacterium]
MRHRASVAQAFPPGRSGATRQARQHRRESLRRCLAAIGLIACVAGGAAHAAFDRKAATPTPAPTPAPLAGEPAAPPGSSTPVGGSASQGKGASGTTPVATLGKGVDGQLHIESPYGFLDYDEETNQVYSRERTRVEYGDVSLEADHVVVDLSLEEAQAEGNVIVKRGTATLTARALRYNYRDGTGVAEDARGQAGPIYFKSNDQAGGPSFEMVNKNEWLARHAEVTTCDFPEPMYEFKAKEAIIFPGDRVMMRSATLYVRGFPVFYLPFYSRSLKGGTPWFFRVGMSNKAGVYIRVGYSYRHVHDVPSWENDEVMATKSRGSLDVFGDYLSKHGPGAGLDYKYEFDFERHEGEAHLYGLTDSNRNVSDYGALIGGENQSGSSNTNQRWMAELRHRSQLIDDVSLQANVQALSDPEVYYDILDRFADEDRGRVSERSGGVAVTLNRDQYLARVNVEVKDRIGFSHYTDPSNPYGRGTDLAVPITDNGISPDRWGRVETKAPEVNFTTNDIRIGRQDLYYRLQLNLFNSLDRGLNTVASDRFTYPYSRIPWTGYDADAYVQGADLYQSLQHVYRFNDRVTWLNKVGLGLGAAARGAQNEPLVDGSQLFAPPGVVSGAPVGKVWDPNTNKWVNMYGFYDGLYFTDPNTFHIGQSPVLRSYDDISSGFAYADFQSRLSARFTDALQGYVRYTVRQTTKDYIGDWYASFGDQLIRDDLYNFPLRSHWLEGSLNYLLLYPHLSLFTNAGLNLTSASSLYPNETRWYYTPIGGSYRSDTGIFSANSSVTFYEQQYFHPEDPRAYLANAVRWNGSVSYQDPGEMWWAAMSADWHQYLNQNINAIDNQTALKGTASGIDFSPHLGAHVGPKWTVEGSTSYNSLTSSVEDMRFLLNRDMHDALLSMRIRLLRDIFGTGGAATTQSGTDKNKGVLQNIDFSLTIQPKLPNTEIPFRVRHRDVLDQKFQQPEVAP